MSIERLQARSERGLIEKFVRYIEECIVAHQQRQSGRFVLGLSGNNGDNRRKRTAEIFSTLAESEIIDWERVCVFLIEERFGCRRADESNGHLVRTTLVSTLRQRNINFTDAQLVLPDTDLATAERCATDYQTRLFNLFKAERSRGPDLVALGLCEDLSISGVFPGWYKEEPKRWVEAISKSFKVLSTESAVHDIPKRICVNLGVIRSAQKIIVDINESTDDSWHRVREGLEMMNSAGEVADGFDVIELGRGRPRSQPPRPHVARANSSMSDEDMRTPERSSSNQPTDAALNFAPGHRLSDRPKPGLPAPPASPLNYLMKYKHITVAQLIVDEGNHYSVIILGAAGDLAMKKTFPALFQLYLANHLPSSARIFGCDDPTFHTEIRKSDDLWEKRLASHLESESGCKPRDLRDFRGRVEFFPVKLSEPGTLGVLDAHIQKLAKGRGCDNRICYLALPPFLFATAVERFRQECWTESGFARVIVEKPFGRNQAEAKELASQLGRHLEESHIYRIDHYLAKTLVLNILTLRFANREFGTLFHTYHVANVRITFQENFGVEGRAGYFNEYGIIRDIMQNHLMQVLTLVAMEAPASLEAEDVRDEKVKVLKQIRPIRAEDCVIGQYEGYQDDPQIQAINKERGYPSRCPTFAVAVLYLDNERWSGVPFIMKAGKSLKTTQTLVRVQFKKAPSHSIFGDQPQNEMVIRIQPNESIYYKMIAKMPGISQKAKDVRRTVLELDLKKGLHRDRIPEAYEKLIYDVLQGESHNFVRKDELEQAWRIFDPLLRELEDEKREPLMYAERSGGPRAADELIKLMGFQKYTPTGMAVSGFSDDEAG